MRVLLLRFSKNYHSKVQKDITSGSEGCHLHYFSDAKLTSETCKAENALISICTRVKKPALNMSKTTRLKYRRI